MTTIYTNTVRRTQKNAKRYYPKQDVQFDTACPIDFGNSRTWLCLNTHDYTCIKFTGGYRKSNNYQSADCVFLDYDHIIAEPNFDAWSAKAHEISKSLTPSVQHLIIPSTSQTGCHILIPLNTEITDGKTYNKIYTALTQINPASDQQVKDNARFSFGSGLSADDFMKYSFAVAGDPLNVKHMVVKYDELHAETRRKSKFSSSFNNTATDPTDGLYFTEGRRATDCHILACRLLNRFPQDEAENKYYDLIADCDLSDYEKKHSWDTAVKSMIGDGLAYRNPMDRQNEQFHYQPKPKSVRPIQNNDYARPAQPAQLADVSPTIDPDVSYDIMDKVKNVFLSNYVHVGERASCVIVDSMFSPMSKYHGEDVLDADVAKGLPALCAHWAKECIPNEVKSALGDLCPATKDVSAIQLALKNYISTLPKPIMNVESLGGWHIYDPSQSKWVKCNDDKIQTVIVSAIDTMRRRLNKAGVMDAYLDLEIKKLASNPKLVEHMKAVFTRQYSDFEKSQAYLLATPKGIVDLRNPQAGVRPTKPDDYVFYTTKCNIVPEGYDPNPDTNLWERTLRQIIPDAGRRQYFEYVMGSQITGKLRYEVMYMWIGNGSNGKSTVFDLIQWILGEYSGTLDPEVLCTGLRKEQYDYGRARVMGKRFIVAGEAGPNLYLAPDQVKRLCSSEDRVSASLKYHNSFDFDNMATINWVANQKPNIRDTKDGGISRRIAVFEFDQKFTKSQRNLHLMDQLKEIGDMVLTWLVNCSYVYIKGGEKIPELPSVERETQLYLKDQDTFELFLKDAIRPCKGYGLTVTSLSYVYQAWCKYVGGYRPNLSIVGFGKAMVSAGYKSKVFKIDGKSVRLFPDIDFNRDSDVFRLASAKEFRGDGVPLSAVLIG